MVLDWKTPEAKERLLASVLASLLPAKLDYHKVAKMYGQQATYNSVEKQFRAIRKMADNLSEEAEGGASSSVPVNNDKSTKKPTTPKKKASPGENGVISGRVKKTTNKPATKRSTKASKLEKHINSELQGDSDDVDNVEDHDQEDLDSGDYGMTAEELYDD